MRLPDVLKATLMVVFVFSACVSFLVNGVAYFMERISSKEMVFRAFGSPETKKRIGELYALIESHQLDSELRQDTPEMSEYYGFPKVRQVPFPRTDLALDHTEDPSFHGPSYIGYAFFDDNNKLIALQFDSSRTGCFVSRSPTLCPRRFLNLYRLSKDNLYITGIGFE